MSKALSRLQEILEQAKNDDVELPDLDEEIGTRDEMRGINGFYQDERLPLPTYPRGDLARVCVQAAPRE